MKKYLRAIPCIVFLVAVFLTLLLKVNYHMDEVWSYGLANHQGDIVMDFELGVPYEPKEVFHDYLVVQEEHRFDYANVWENQRNDNHPPLFYALLHTVCSFFPGTFSKWYCGVLNLAFALVLILFAEKLVFQLTKNRKLQLALSLGFALSYGILNAASYLRMYFMAMCWCTVLASLALSILEKAVERSKAETKGPTVQEAWSLYFAYAVICYLGALTHYYCVAFIILLSVSLLVALFCYKQWVHGELLLASTLLAALGAYWSFPDMVRHVFAGDRGSESLQNLEDTSDYPQRLKYFFHMMDDQLFGGFLIALLVLLAVLIVVAVVLHVKVDYVPYAVLLFPVLGFYLLIGKTAVYETDRYMFPIFALLFLLVFCLLFTLCYGLIRGFNLRYSPKYGKRAATLTLAAVLVVCMAVPLAGSFRKAEWEYLYRRTAPYLKMAEQYEDYDVLCIYHARWQVPTCYLEMLHYKSVTFLWDGKIKGVAELPLAKSDHVLVRVISEENDGHFLKEAMDQLPQFTDYKDLFNYWFGTTTELLP